MLRARASTYVVDDKSFNEFFEKQDTYFHFHRLFFSKGGSEWIVFLVFLDFGQLIHCFGENLEATPRLLGLSYLLGHVSGLSFEPYFLLFVSSNLYLPTFFAPFFVSVHSCCSHAGNNTWIRVPYFLLPCWMKPAFPGEFWDKLRLSKISYDNNNLSE